MLKETTYKRNMFSFIHLYNAVLHSYPGIFTLHATGLVFHNKSKKMAKRTVAFKI